MDFADTPQEAEYRARATAFLDTNAELKRHDRPELAKRLSPADLLAAARDWQRLKAESGFACITLPECWGGAGGTAMQETIFAQTEEHYDVPTGIFQVSLGMCVPSVLALADEDTKQRFVRPAVRGEEIWCQLFSEPAAGSDLAGVRTRAVPDQSGNWTINGQKVWTTNAHLADFGLLLARTDPTVPKHRGLTMFWIDMRSPGVEVRPIRQISGASGFSEVFFSDATISDTQRLSGVGDGWKAAQVTMRSQRSATGGSKGADYPDLYRLAKRLSSCGKSILGDASFRQRLADFYVKSEGVRLTRLRSLTAVSRGQAPGPEASIAKLVNASLLQDLTSYALDLQEERGMLVDDGENALGGVFHQGLLKAPGSRIAGGTDEILRNLIAERILGLPGDVRTDKDVPFQDLPAG